MIVMNASTNVLGTRYSEGVYIFMNAHIANILEALFMHFAVLLSPFYCDREGTPPQYLFIQYQHTLRSPQSTCGHPGACEMPLFNIRVINEQVRLPTEH